MIRTSTELFTSTRKCKAVSLIIIMKSEEMIQSKKRNGLLCGILPLMLSQQTGMSTLTAVYRKQKSLIVHPSA